MVHCLFNTYKVIMTTGFSFTPVFVSRREALSYLIRPKLRDHVETPINVLMFICTSCTEVNTTSLRKSIFPSKFLSSLIHLLEGQREHPRRPVLMCLQHFLSLKVREVNIFLVFLVICCRLQSDLWPLSQDTAWREKIQ